MTHAATVGTRAAKNELHDAFAQVGKALANGHRIELLDLLAQGGKVQLDEERKAAMVSNLLVVLCADREAQPVVNAGSIY